MLKLPKKTALLASSLLLSVALLGQSITSAPLLAQGSQSVSQAAEEQVDVIFQVKPSANAGNVIRSLEGTLDREVPIIGGYTAKLPASQVDKLQSHPSVVQATISQQMTNSNKQKIGKDNLLEKAIGKATHRGLVLADKVSETGKGVTVAVLDSRIGGSQTKLNVVHSVASIPMQRTARIS